MNMKGKNSEHSEQRKCIKTSKGEVLDNIIHKYFCEPVSPWFFELGHTPNMISIYGTCFTIAFLYYLALDDMVRFTIYFWIAYLLDCLDGYYARKYDMVTEFGDLFEHSRDILAICIMLYIWVINYTITKEVYLILFVTSIFTGIHIGCQQTLYTNRKHVETLDVLRILCVHENFLQHFHYFGVGCYMVTLNLLTLLMSIGIFYMIRSLMMFLSIIMIIGYGREIMKNRRNTKDDVIIVRKEILRMSEHEEKEISDNA